MKKVAFFTIMMLVAIAASAQEVGSNKKETEYEIIDMNRTFSVGGEAIMCLTSKTATKKNLQALEWTLKNDHIGETNIVVIDVKNAKTGQTVAHQSWSDGVYVRMRVDKDKKPVTYEVYDDMFNHLLIAQLQLGTIIQLYSELLKK